MHFAPIASVLFVYGVSRPVYLDADGQHYVFDGNPVYGVWVYVDEPEILEERIDCTGDLMGKWASLKAMKQSDSTLP